MRKIIILVFLGLCMSTTLLAQSNFALTYSMALPMGDMSDHIDKISFRGIALDYRYEIQDNIALGFNLGMNTFYQELGSDTYTVENVSLTGKQYRYNNNIPMLFTVTYFMDQSNRVRPFATLGAGVMYSRQNTDMNLYTIELEAWNFTLQPEVGVQVEVAEQAALQFSLKYFNGFKAGSELPISQSFLSFNVGFAFY